MQLTSLEAEEHVLHLVLQFKNRLYSSTVVNANVRRLSKS